MLIINTMIYWKFSHGPTIVARDNRPPGAGADIVSQSCGACWNLLSQEIQRPLASRDESPVSQKSPSSIARPPKAPAVPVPEPIDHVVSPDESLPLRGNPRGKRSIHFS